MQLPIYQVDAFADAVFAGNPAAIVPLEAWLPDATMQAIAAENNLAETAFFVPEGGARYGLRWFTPAAEVDLCGHATLATAWLIFHKLRQDLNAATFATRSGDLHVTLSGESGRITMDFPARIGQTMAVPPPVLLAALGGQPLVVLEAAAYMAVYATADEVRALKPDMAGLAGLEKYGIIATAPGDRPGIDCVSRFFAPRVGVPEDPVTGSAHCSIVPYWAERLGKAEIIAYQASARGGTLYCRNAGERVFMAGKAVLFLEGSIRL
ncbi:PhzF family phenazine biosynthesis protein [Ferrovibrio sp.]|uniref:PhzF family phenazine biosynthesis protein n=1 Tax=Ferrovibrio sp. TaxID=1917215 RepID=UPI003D291FEF